MARDYEAKGGQDDRGSKGPVETGRLDTGSPDDEHVEAPLGAIAVTTFLAITILVMWFGMYFLNIARSS